MTEEEVSRCWTKNSIKETESSCPKIPVPNRGPHTHHKGKNTQEWGGTGVQKGCFPCCQGGCRQGFENSFILGECNVLAILQEWCCCFFLMFFFLINKVKYHMGWISIREDSVGVIRFISASVTSFYRVSMKVFHIRVWISLKESKAVCHIDFYIFKGFSSHVFFRFFFGGVVGQIFSVNLLWIEPICLLTCKLTWIVYCWS